MTDDIESAFVEIVARAPEVDAAAERLVPLYEDPAPDPEPASRSRRGALTNLVLTLMVVLLSFAALWLVYGFVVWLGVHGQLPAPK